MQAASMAAMWVVGTAEQWVCLLVVQMDGQKGDGRAEMLAVEKVARWACLSVAELAAPKDGGLAVRMAVMTAAKTAAEMAVKWVAWSVVE